MTGVYPMHFLQAMRTLGCEVEHFLIPPAHRVHVRKWLVEHVNLFAEKHVVIDFANHYGVVLGGQYQCGVSLGPVDWATQLIPWERGEVSEYMVINRLPMAVPGDTVASDRRLLQRARKLAARYGIDIAHEYAGSFVVSCPALEDDDPHEGWREAETARQVLDQVEDYVACLLNGYLEAVTDPRLWESSTEQGWLPLSTARAADRVGH
ncbi:MULTISPECIES: hypothetical protein [unclassified Acidovorax]|uniref:hypothetical protein n=1 Tax=unclassified Acidovorax TaxID=2684926 RepID=UPI003ECCAAC8